MLDEMTSLQFEVLRTYRALWPTGERGANIRAIATATQNAKVLEPLFEDLQCSDDITPDEAAASFRALFPGS